jgi:dolichol-phosphate mannosyltransferase
LSGSERAPLELAVVLPTYNERGNVRAVIARLEQALAGVAWEAIFVDDDSRDGTADEAREISRVDPRIRVLQRIGRRGLASAAIEGMCATAAPVVAVMDADLQHDPALLPEMLAALRSGEFDVAVASRFAPGASMADGTAPTARRPRRWPIRWRARSPGSNSAIR